MGSSLGATCLSTVQPVDEQGNHDASNGLRCGIPQELHHRHHLLPEVCPTKTIRKSRKSFKTDLSLAFCPQRGQRVARGASFCLFREAAHESYEVTPKCALRDFLLPFGGLGATPPVICADGAVASPRRKSPHREKRRLRRLFRFHRQPRSGPAWSYAAGVDSAGVFRRWRHGLGVTVFAPVGGSAPPPGGGAGGTFTPSGVPPPRPGATGVAGGVGAAQKGGGAAPAKLR